MTENGPTGTTSEPLTVWERRTASFQDALSSGWRSYRLVPWLFKHAGRVEPVELTPEAFGGAELYATTDFSLERGYGLDGMAKEWGASIARGETAALTAKLGEQCSIEPTNDAIRHELYEVLSRIGNDDTVAILAPSRGRLLRALELGPPEDLPWLPGVGARSLLRGTFEGICVFATQPADATDLWVIDFSRIAWWQHAGPFDDIATHADLRRDRFATINGSRDIATQITAEEFFAIALDDLRAARGLRVRIDAA